MPLTRVLGVLDEKKPGLFRRFYAGLQNFAHDLYLAAAELSEPGSSNPDNPLYIGRAPLLPRTQK